MPKQFFLFVLAVFLFLSSALAYPRRPRSQSAGQSASEAKQNTEGAKPPEPFGFRVGMTRAQVIALVGQKSVSKDETDLLQLTTAPMPHPDFETYIVSNSSSTGVAQVMALSQDIDTNVYGDGVKSKFDDIKAALDEKYGQPTNGFGNEKKNSVF